LEKAYSKQKILELYLNQIYLGLGAYGVGAASLSYFGKKLSELTAAEAAFLAALPKAPSTYHPIRHPERSKTRRDWVIDRMVELHVLTPEL
ncbi:transglycosylase domain-containing protein, partial [Staphylococcus aureus]